MIKLPRIALPPFYRNYAVLSAALFVIFFYLELTTAGTSVSLMFKISGAIADSSVFFVLLSLLRGRWRIIAPMTVFILMVIVLANVLYFRCFNDIIPSTAYFNSRLNDPTIVEGAGFAFRFADLILVSAGLLPLGYYLWKGKKEILCGKSKTAVIRVGIVMLIAGWSISVAGTYRRNAIYNGRFSFGEINERIFSKNINDWKTIYRNLNFSGYVVYCLNDILRSPFKTLTIDQEQMICDYFEKKTGQALLPELPPDSLRTNLIIIVVESLESSSLKADPDIYPTLAGLVNDQNTVYVDCCRVQADYGRSSDAHFIINTGLLPLRHEALVNRYALNDYPSLAKSLNCRSLELIGEDRSLWSHGLTTRSYGFDTLIDNVAPDGCDRDSIILENAAQQIGGLPQPFFAFITTISMHDPYTTHTVSSDLSGRFEDDRDREYFERLNHFDTALGQFIATLKDLELFDRTLIVIVGDHEIRGGTTSLPPDDSVPLIILNSPVKDRRTEGISQIDIFPTVLYLMGVSYNFMGAQYTGVGTNIFYKDHVAGTTDCDYDISELIIRRKFSPKS